MPVSSHLLGSSWLLPIAYNFKIQTPELLTWEYCLTLSLIHLFVPICNFCPSYAIFTSNSCYLFTSLNSLQKPSLKKRIKPQIYLSG